MSYPINYPTPQGANIQIFQAPVRAVSTAWTAEWVKPQGASMVWFTLIGAGSAADSIEGGGSSGAVTNCMVPAFLIPDVLQVRVGTGGTTDGGSGSASSVLYQQKAGTGYTLLTANGGDITGGAASTSNYFSAMGFFQSIRGQAGSTGFTTAAATTFLSGGGRDGVTANYGYGTSRNGFFQAQPIIVGVGGNTSNGKGGTGCGGGFTSGSFEPGGDGLVVIITW
jgi:hypothetical protein